MTELTSLRCKALDGGRPMEVDARNGAVVRFGRKHGIATPSNEMAATLLALQQLAWALTDAQPPGNSTRPARRWPA